MPQISQQRLLALLAKSAVGPTQAFLRARGFQPGVLAALVRGGLATLVPGGLATARTARAIRKKARVKITEAGRAALSELYDPSSFGARRDLSREIMALCPPPPRCKARARLILERQFTFYELRVLVQALRDGIANEQRSTVHARRAPAEGHPDLAE